MNYSEALSFAFEDHEWLKKLLIGGLLAFLGFFAGLIFITGFFILGYYVAVLRNVINQEEKPLPDWADFGKIFVDGVMAGIIFVIYFLVIGGIGAIPIVHFAMDPYMLGVEKGISITVISLIILFFLCFFSNAGIIRFALTNNFAEAFNFSAMAHLLRHNLGNFIAIIIFSAILNCILFLAGFGIISPFTNFWGFLVQAHLFGQCARAIHKNMDVVHSVEA